MSHNVHDLPTRKTRARRRLCCSTMTRRVSAVLIPLAAVEKLPH